MQFEIKKTADYGTSHPVVARLLMQTDELIKFYSIPGDIQKEVFKVIHDEVLPKLMACHKIQEGLEKTINDAREKIASQGLDVQANGRVYTIPSIPDLKITVDNYLYNAKSTLRDFVLIINALFQKNFERDAREYEKAIPKWARKHFGENGDFPEM